MPGEQVNVALGHPPLPAYPGQAIVKVHALATYFRSKDFLIKFTKKLQKSARSTFMLLTLRRVGLLFPGKDFFANCLVFRQPLKEGLPAPLYLGQFQRVGGLFSVVVAGHLQHIHRHLGKQCPDKLLDGIRAQKTRYSVTL